MKIVIDMNLSPVWTVYLQEAGFEAIHWSKIGNPNAPDQEIMAWALENNAVVFTNDLDFSAILAATQAQSPSVFQIRTQDLLPDQVAEVVISTLRQFEDELFAGALLSLDKTKSRVRILPMN
jgi:predicted nuclease of predicted toxin-antitoxin system